jgi:predicted nucleotidyltransferase
MDAVNIVSEISDILAQYGIEKVILFGSYASGTENKYSDIDLMIIKNIPENETRDLRISLKKALWLKLGELSFSLDIIVDNEKRIQERIEMGDLFYIPRTHNLLPLFEFVRNKISIEDVNVDDIRFSFLVSRLETPGISHHKRKTINDKLFLFFRASRAIDTINHKR